MFRTISTILAFAALISNGVSAPALIQPCQHSHFYTVDTHTPYSTTNLVTGWSCDGRAAGCSIAVGKSYSVTVGITIGGSAGFSADNVIKEALSIPLGLDAGFSISKTTGSTITVTESCPQGFQCGLIATAQMVTLGGIMRTSGTEGCLTVPKPAPYSINVPQTKPTNGQDAGTSAAVEFAPCTLIGTTTSPNMVVCPA
ncbi:MAG: hypothetical protein M1812_003961 [Candelaria pacifica]|nr:MAG: hypothetical protein M1812_003961 [Candelaria pacifica]